MYESKKKLYWKWENILNWTINKISTYRGLWHADEALPRGKFVP